MYMNRWFISVAVACLGFITSFMLSFKVNNLDTSLIRGFLSFVACFALYELLRFVVIYSFGDLFMKKISEEETETTDEEKNTYENNTAEKGENSPIDKAVNQNAQNTNGNQADSITIQNESDYADVAKFVKKELAKSESNESESASM